MKKRSVFLCALLITTFIIAWIAYGFEKLTFSSTWQSFFNFNKNSESNLLNESENLHMGTFNEQNLNNLVLKSENFAKNAVQTSSGYESLTNNHERMCYNFIKSNANKITNEKYKNDYFVIEPITVENCKLSSAQIKKVLYAIQNDHPEIFWIANDFGCSYFGNRTILKLNSIMAAGEQKISFEKLENKLKSIIEQIPKSNSDYDIELFLHDYIIDNCKYEKVTANHKNLKVYTAYGCLVEGSAVCEGYSKAMQLLLCSAGVKCRTVTGARGAEAHMWNIAKINDAWYHIDVTWNDSGDLQRYNYFNVSDDIIKKDHVINLQIDQLTNSVYDKRYNFKLPLCNSMNENYFEKNALKISSLDSKTDEQIINKLYNLATRKYGFIYLKLHPTLDFDLTVKQLFSTSLYKFFGYLKEVNKKLAKNTQINSKKIYYSENKNQNVLTIQLNYS